jgi:hypothetical protein
MPAVPPPSRYGTATAFLRGKRWLYPIRVADAPGLPAPPSASRQAGSCLPWPLPSFPAATKNDMRATSGLLLHGDLTAGKPSEVKPRFKMSQNVGQNPGSGILIVAGFEPGNKRTNPAGTDAPGQLILREPCASAQTPQPLPEFFGRSESVGRLAQLVSPDVHYSAHFPARRSLS